MHCLKYNFWFVFRQRTKSIFEFGRFSYEAFVLMSDSFSRLARLLSVPLPGVGRLPVLPIEGKMPERAEGVFQFRCKDTTLFCIYKIKMNFFVFL